MIVEIRVSLTWRARHKEVDSANLRCEFAFATIQTKSRLTFEDAFDASAIDTFRDEVLLEDAHRILVGVERIGYFESQARTSAGLGYAERESAATTEQVYDPERTL